MRSYAPDPQSPPATDEAAAPKGRALKADLRRRIAAIENRRDGLVEPELSQATIKTNWDFGIEPVDRSLPGGLTVGGLHEAAPAGPGDETAASAFLLSLILRRRTQLLDIDKKNSPCMPLLWCQSAFLGSEFGRPYLPALKRLGLRDGLLVLRARREGDVLWALEEGLRAGSLGAVLGEIRTAPFLATRRLQLAAAETGVPCLLLTLNGLRTASAAETRWRIASRPGGCDPLDPKAPGAARWHVELARARSGTPGAWDMEFNHATHTFHLAPGPADRALEAPRERRAAG